MLKDKELQHALNKLSEYHNLVNKYRYMITIHCREVYGYDPAEVDNNEFIDCCDGGCGMCNSMSVEDFKKSMEESILLSGKK